MLVVSVKKHPKNKMESAPPLPLVHAALQVNWSSHGPPSLCNISAAAICGGHLHTQVSICPKQQGNNHQNDKATECVLQPSRKEIILAFSKYRDYPPKGICQLGEAVWGGGGFGRRQTWIGDQLAGVGPRETPPWLRSLFLHLSPALQG